MRGPRYPNRPPFAARKPPKAPPPSGSAARGQTPEDGQTVATPEDGQPIQTRGPDAR